MGRIEQVFRWEPLNCKLQAMHLSATDYFKFDIDFQVANNVCLLQFRLLTRVSDINPFTDSKIDMYEDYKRFFLL